MNITNFNASTSMDGLTCSASGEYTLGSSQVLSVCFMTVSALFGAYVTRRLGARIGVQGALTNVSARVMGGVSGRVKAIMARFSKNRAPLEVSERQYVQVSDLVARYSRVRCVQDEYGSRSIRVVLTVNRDLIARDPFSYLYIILFWLERPVISSFDQITMEFEGEAGVDSGGVKAEFFRLLMEGLFKKSDGSLKDVLSFHQSDVGRTRKSKSEIETAYKIIGRVLFSYWVSPHLVLENLFSERVFQVFGQVRGEDLSALIHKPDSYSVLLRKFSRKLLLVEKEPSYACKVQILDFLDIDESKRDYQEVEYLAESLKPEIDLEKLRECDSKAYKTEIEKILNAAVHSDLCRAANLLFIAWGFYGAAAVSTEQEGFQDSISSVERVNEGRGVLSRIQSGLNRGRVEKSLVLSVSVEHLSEDMQKKSNDVFLCLKSWVKEEATDQELRAFVRFVTSNGSINESTSITIAPLFSEEYTRLTFVSQTCFRRIDAKMPAGALLEKEDVFSSIRRSLDATGFGLE